MKNWFDITLAVACVTSRQLGDRIADAAYAARIRMNFRASGDWLAALPDFKERYRGDWYLVAVEVFDPFERQRRRYNPRGVVNFSVKVPLAELAPLTTDQMTTYFEKAYLQCCQDSAKRWGATIGWRVEPELI